MIAKITMSAALFLFVMGPPHAQEQTMARELGLVDPNPNSLAGSVEAQRVLQNPPATGLFVFQIFPEGSAYKAGVRVGDIITHYDGQPIATHAELSQLARTVNNDKRDEILVLIHRGAKELEITTPRGPMGVRLEDVVEGETRTLPRFTQWLAINAAAVHQTMDQRVKTMSNTWKLVRLEGSVGGPIGWCHDYLASTSEGFYASRLNQMLKQDNASLQQDVYLVFDDSHDLTPNRIRLAVNDKLVLDVRRNENQYIGTRTGVNVSATAIQGTVSAYLVPFLASVMVENRLTGKFSCSYLPPGSLEAAPFSEIDIVHAGHKGSFLLRKLGREEMRGEILPGGEIGTVHLRGGMRIEPATKEQVLAAFPDAESLFPPIEQLPKDAPATTQRAN